MPLMTTEEKTPFLASEAEEELQTQNHPSQLPVRFQKRASSRSTRSVCQFYLGVFLLSLLITGAVRKVSGPKHAPLGYPGETIAWEPCGERDGHRLECGSLDVPMDHYNEENSGDVLFNIKMIRFRGHDAPAGRNILLNPGGPGGSGIELVERVGTQLNAIVGEGHNLIGFDPRGVNSSTPRATCFPDNDSRLRLSSFRDRDAFADRRQVYAWMDSFTRGCADTMGEYAPYFNTPQTAADMNSIIDALGQKDMIYWGFSYGTILGQTYATLFPERAHRIMIDGVVNLKDYYKHATSHEPLTDTERCLEGFVDECIKAGEDCALYALADTKDALLDKMYEWRKELKENPVPVYVNEKSYGVMDDRKVFLNGIYPTLYKPAKWYEAAQRLYKLYQGDGTDAFESYGGAFFFDQPGDPFEYININDGPHGPEDWPQEREAITDELSEYFNASIFAPLDNDYFYMKQKWRVPNTHHFQPKDTVETAHPLLILTTRYDPVTPLKSAQSARDIFKGSRVVDVYGYGHATIAVPSSCIASHIRNFLYEGVLPDEDTTCDIDGPYYFVPPEETESLIASATGDEPDDVRLQIALLELARDVELGAHRRL